MDKAAAGLESGREARERTEKKARAMLNLAMKRIREGLDAEIIKAFCSNGEVTEAGPYVDHTTRLKAADMVVTLCDAKPADKVDVNHTATDDLIQALQDAKARAMGAKP